jgi:L-threonylcarbamoyladenylate synthase
VLRVDAAEPSSEAIRRAAETVSTGGLVAFPTETVYGLGANALDAEAVAGIFAAKGRPANNPLIVHVATIDAVRQLAAQWPITAVRLAERFWPGPLSLVLPKVAAVPDIVTAGAATVGLRIPRHPVALALLEAAGVPIAAPSANRSEAISPTTAEHVLKGLDGRIDLVLDGGATPGGLESTVLDLSCSPPRLLRPGLVSRAEIETVIGPIASVDDPGEPDAAECVQPDDVPLASPGMMRRHYAPRAVLECVDDGRGRVKELTRQGIKTGWLALARPNANAAMDLNLTCVIGMPSNAADYASRLYAALHACDDAGVERIVVDRPPHDAAWLAVHDRLRRAAAPPNV